MAISNNVYIDFTKEPNVPLFAKTTGALASAVNDQEDYFLVGGKHYFEVCQNLASTALAAGFQAGATGWLVPTDGAAEGLEITRGILTGSASKFVVGTSPAFYVRCTYKTATIANNLLFAVGFRKLGAYDAAFATAANAYTDYDDQAFIGTIDASGTCYTFTSKATTDAQTALAHAVVAASTWCQLEVKVSATGAVTYRIGTSLVSQVAAEAALAADASAVAFTMTSAIEVVPCIKAIGTVGGAGDHRLLKFECGLQ
jgi:hypothetical protein